MVTNEVNYDVRSDDAIKLPSLDPVLIAIFFQNIYNKN